MKSSPLELYWVYPLVLWRVAHVATPTKPPAGDIFTAPRSGIGLVCGFAATDSRLYYNRVPLVINFGYTQDSRRDALWPSPTKTPSGAIFYEPRGTRSEVVSLSLLPRSGIRKGRPVKADRYALRVSRSVVVTLSLSPRSGI